MKKDNIFSKLYKKVTSNDTNLLMSITIVVFFVMYLMAMLVIQEGFLRPQTFLNILNENAFLIILSVGLTIVMITGEIDISVGGVTCLISMVCAKRVEEGGASVWACLLIGLLIGLAFGVVQGALVAYLDIQPFIVTLAGMFFARGMTTIVSQNPIRVTKQSMIDISNYRIVIPGLGYTNDNGIFVKGKIEIGVIIALALVIIMAVVLKKTKIGRSFYAVGGNPQSALMLGINVRRTKFISHVFCGVLAGIGGFVYFLHSCSGNPSHASGAEMNAIASSIIGGTMLTGGVGNVVGTLFGVLSLNTIKSIVAAAGLDDSWWIGITVAAMLCIFLVIQSVVVSVRKKRNSKS